MDVVHWLALDNAVIVRNPDDVFDGIVLFTEGFAIDHVVFRDDCALHFKNTDRDFARAIEAAHGIKE